MATSPTTMTPPPGADDSSSPAPAAPTTPAAASPSPAQPSPANLSTGEVIKVFDTIRGWAKAYAAFAPHAAKALDELRHIMPIMMSSQSPGEPQAGPGPS